MAGGWRGRGRGLSEGGDGGGRRFAGAYAFGFVGEASGLLRAVYY